MKISGILSLFITCFLLFSLRCSFAQEFKVVKILDSNLFELSDGRIVKMAGIDAPRKDHPVKYLAALSKRIIDYSEKVLEGRRFQIIPASDSLYTRSSENSISYSLIYISKLYPVGSSDINKRFLELGFGRFTDNVDSLHRDDYLRAEKIASEHGKGLWQNISAGFKDTLDRTFTLQERAEYAAVDSSQMKFVFADSLNMKVPAAVKLFSEVLVGGGLGTASMVALGIAGGFMGGGISPGGPRSHALSGLIVGGYAGYLIGSSLGVYAIAKRYNPNVIYLGAFASGLAGAAIGLGINSFLIKHNIGNSLFINFALPLLGSIIYANSVSQPAVWLDETDNFRQNNSNYGSLAFKDYRNRLTVSFIMNFQLQ